MRYFACVVNNLYGYNAHGKKRILDGDIQRTKEGLSALTEKIDNITEKVDISEPERKKFLDDYKTKHDDLSISHAKKKEERDHLINSIQSMGDTLVDLKRRKVLHKCELASIESGHGKWIHVNTAAAMLNYIGGVEDRSSKFSINGVEHVKRLEALSHDKVHLSISVGGVITEIVVADDQATVSIVDVQLGIVLRKAQIDV